MPEIWKKCSSCKKDILTGQKYFVCSVSTCQGKITNYAFCSVDCWDAHLPIERHRPDSAGAIERIAPAEPAPAEPARKIIPSSSPSASGSSSTSVDDEVLVVVSKVRKYVSEKTGLNTSAEVYDTLTERIKRLCDRAAESAKSQGRKTLMSRDFS